MLESVIDHVHASYYPTSKLRPASMLLGGLGGVAEKHPALKVAANATEAQLDFNGRHLAVRLDEVVDRGQLKDRSCRLLVRLAAELGSDRAQVERAFVNGMLGALDPYSVLFTPEHKEETKVAVAGSFGGVGLVISKHANGIVVDEVLPGLEQQRSPSYLSGLESGDILVEVGGMQTAGASLGAVVDKLRGPVGTNVAVTIRRSTWPEARRFELTRAKIAASPIRTMLLSGDIGYFRIQGLDRATPSALESALADLGAQSQSGGLKGLVLDLRSCQGGLLESAVAVADVFLATGTIMTNILRDRRERHTAKAGGAGESLPLVVLVSETTRSSAELVAGSLQRNNRAVLMGRRTLGKGSAQSLFDVPDGGQVSLTTCETLVGDDQAFDLAGIEPDVEMVPQSGRPPSPSTRTLPARERPAYSIVYQEAPGTALTRIDPQIDLAREVLLASPRTARAEQLQGSAGLLAAMGTASLAAPATGPAATGSIPRIWTVAVGISKFKEASISLAFADRDARAFDELISSARADSVPAERRALLVDAQATRSAILGALSNASRRALQQDMIVLFMATHGLPDGRGALYFLTHDTDPRRLADTGLPERDVELAIGSSKAKRIVMLVDACHSGAAGFGTLSGARGLVFAETNQLVGKMAQTKPGVAVFTASSATESSFEAATWGNGHGVFSYYLMRGMSGEADTSRDGFVSIRELYDFTYRRVAEDTKGAQHPELKGAFDNAMPLARVGK